MRVQLSDEDKRMLDGERGETARFAMRIVAKMADVVQASELMDISQAHIDGCGLLSEAGLEFAEKLASGGGQVAVPTTLNMGPLDLRRWRDLGVEETFAQKAIRQAEAYESMGCAPTWTCAPYQGYLTPRFGAQIAWGESNAVLYANSVLGARTNRYADYMDICAAITGRVPRAGLHLDENRRGQVLLRLDPGLDPGLFRRDAFYPVLGYCLGRAVGEEVPVIVGLRAAHANDDRLKALGAAAASAGAVALFHAVGVTPEAPTLEAAFGGRQPERVVEIGLETLRAAWDELSTAKEEEALDAVVLGCPHYSFEEFRRLAAAIGAHGGKRSHPDVTFMVITSRQSYALLEGRADLLAAIENFGARLATDTCVFHSPMLAPSASVVMTDSGKCAYYAPGELETRVAFASMEDCVRSAVEGRIRRKPLLL